jgi:hypothetical protein
LGVVRYARIKHQAVLSIIHIPKPDYFMDIIQREARKAATM